MEPGLELHHGSHTRSWGRDRKERERREIGEGR
jgi:hypothetical protein